MGPAWVTASEDVSGARGGFQGFEPVEESVAGRGVSKKDISGTTQTHSSLIRISPCRLERVQAQAKLTRTQGCDASRPPLRVNMKFCRLY